MFTSLKQRILLGIYIFILISIPAGSFLASKTQNINSKASNPKATVKPMAKPSTPPKTSTTKQLLDDALKNSAVLNATQSGNEDSESTSPTIADSFGPTMSFKIKLEGRTTDQTTKLFVGIIEGNVTSNPKFLLTFSIDVPASGEFSNLSLAGLTSGNQYTAILKGSAQIATASAFTMAPATTNLNSGNQINMLTGDLNEDNVINVSDYSIVQKLWGATPASANWNENADFNQDLVINAIDLAFIVANMGKVGASGTWTSPIPKAATSSGALSPEGTLPIGSTTDGTTTGYWIWVPNITTP